MTKRGRSGPPEAEMVITTVSLEPKTYRRLQHLAVDEGVAVRELIRRAVTDFLKRKVGKGQR